VNVRYHPLFERDVQEASRWYDDRESGLGDLFVVSVEDSVHNILDDPLRYAETSLRVRYQKISKFPYVVLFDVVNDSILILGVLHTARSLDKWRERSSDFQS